MKLARILIGILIMQQVSFAQNIFPADGPVGIGTTNPGNKLSFGNVINNTAHGLTWYDPAPHLYGIHRTLGDWAAPNYQQLRLSWETGLIIDPGSLYGKSYLDVKGNGIRVTEGSIGIGTTIPGNKLSFGSIGNNTSDGITWYDPSPHVYGIHRTAGTWAAPDYQQLRLGWDTGVIIDPGSLYGKSYVDIKGNGLRISDGSVGIGTVDTKGYKLAVAGNVIAESVKVALQGTWPDYVFSPENKLPSLPEVERFIKENNHLPEIPSVAEVKKDGINLGEMDAKLLKKIEELTLHLIEQDKKIKKQEQLINVLLKNAGLD